MSASKNVISQVSVRQEKLDILKGHMSGGWYLIRLFLVIPDKLRTVY